MIKATSTIKLHESKGDGVIQTDHDKSPRERKLHFPVLKLEKVKKQREEHKELLQTLFPNPVRLSRLIHDVEKSFATEFASMIGSVDFAEQRLAGLLMALKELAQKIENEVELSLEEIKEHIDLDQRIHASFEDLIHDCANFSLREVSA